MSTQPRLRLWPALVIVVWVAFAATVLPAVATRTMLHFLGMFLSLILAPLAVAVWWATASRARGWFRWLPPALLLLPAVGFIALVYPKAPQNVLAYAAPAVAFLWVGVLVVGRLVAGDARPAAVYAALVAGWAAFGLVRVDEADSEAMPDWRWVWTPSKEDRFLAEQPTKVAVAESAAVTVGPGDWPEFRGVNRDGRVVGVRLAADDWSANPPRLVWKHKVGPGWGCFSVAGGRLFTQEQRGPNECVVCYDAATGAEVWEAAEPARFTEAIAGPGPRGTPTVHAGRVYAQGATGPLHCLDAATGKTIWKTDIKAGTGGVVPQWGYSSSPLVAGDKVIVYAGGPGGKGTAAFAAADGRLLWAAGDAAHGYASAQLATLGGLEQVLMASDYGLEAFAPADGRRLWKFAWPNPGGNRCTQPAVLDDKSVLIGTGVGGDQGTKRLTVTRSPDGSFAVAVAWTCKRLRPYFNDGVVSAGHYYGFDDKSLVCVDLADGAVKWSAGSRYGHGQVLLLADAGRLVVLGDRGQAAVVAADPGEFTELGRFPALTGKTWNHPVAAHGRLYVRNGEEAACYDLGG